MNRKQHTVIRRLAVSVAIALPMTVALLFLMTRLISPGDHDPVVTRMIRDIELHRIELPVETVGIQVFELPSPVDPLPEPLVHSTSTAEIIDRAEPETLQDDALIEERPAHVIDWWAEARRISQESDEKTFKRWLLEQGYEPYVSIMQGALPISDSVQATLPPSQEDKTGYLNTYGDLELKISDNCVIQKQVSARNDISDFAKNLPMRVVCKPTPRLKFPFDRNNNE